MKILNYKQHRLITEEVFYLHIDTNDTTEGVLKSCRNNMQEILNFMEELGYLKLEDVVMGLKASPMPDDMKKYMVSVITLIYDKNFRATYVKLLDKIIDRLLNGLSPQDLKDDKEIIDISDSIKVQMEKILDVDDEELEKLTKQFVGGMEKYSKSKKDAIDVSDVDPYGEEEWDDLSYEERIKRAFED
jgi:hypothetical protein